MPWRGTPPTGCTNSQTRHYKERGHGSRAHSTYPTVSSGARAASSGGHPARPRARPLPAPSPCLACSSLPDTGCSSPRVLEVLDPSDPHLPAEPLFAAILGCRRLAYARTANFPQLFAGTIARFLATPCWAGTHAGHHLPAAIRCDRTRAGLLYSRPSTCSCTWRYSPC